MRPGHCLAPGKRFPAEPPEHSRVALASVVVAGAVLVTVRSVHDGPKALSVPAQAAAARRTTQGITHAERESTLTHRCRTARTAILASDRSRWGRL